MPTFIFISLIIVLSLYTPLEVCAQIDFSKATDNKTSLDTVLADRFYNNAKNFADSSRFDSSIFYYKKAGDIYLAAKLWQKCTASYNKIGRILIIKESLKEAEDYLNRAVELNLKHVGNQNKELAESYSYLGRLFGRKGSYIQAIEFYEKALDITKIVYGQDHTKVASGYGNIAIIYDRQGDIDKSYQYNKKALDIFLKTYGQEHRLVASSYNNIGLLFDQKGYSDSALVYQKRALTIRQKTLGKNHLHIAASYNNIAHIYYNQGDYYNALIYEEKALTIRQFSLNELHPAIAWSYNNIGCIYYELAEYDQALNYQNRGLDIRKSVLKKDHLEVAASYTNIGNIYEKLAQYTQAMEYYQKVLDIQIDKRGTSHPDVAACYHNIAQMYQSKKEFDKSIAYFRRANAIYINEFGFKHPKIALNYNKIAENFYQKSTYDSTLSYIQKAIHANILTSSDSIIINSRFLTNVLAERELLTSLVLKAEALSINGDHLNGLLKSRTYFKMASDLIKYIRKQYRIEKSKLVLAKRVTEILEKALKNELRLYQLTENSIYFEQALRYSEYSKTGVLLESFVENEAQLSADIPDSLRQKEQQLSADLVYYTAKSHNLKLKNMSSDSIIITNLDNKIFKLNIEYQNLLDFFAKQYPRYNELRYKTQSVSITDIKNRLKQRDIFIEYLVVENAIYIFIVSSEYQNIITVNIDNGFANLVESYVKSIKKNRHKEFKKISPELYSYLIKPIKNLIDDKDKLIIIPDGVLLYIPFGSLITDDNLEFQESEFTDLNYLIKYYDISYHYSATLWLKSLENELSQKSTDDSFIGFAPIFKSESDTGDIAANENLFFDSSLVDLTIRSLSIDGKHYNELLYSENEINDIVRLFGKRSKDAKGYLNTQASENNFKEKISGYKYVHVATHGFSNDHRSDISGLVFSNALENFNPNSLFAPSDTTSTANTKYNDGILYAGEMYNLDLSADLLVLSACETGIGKLVQGEGLMAMTRGFLYAGAENILFSLWKVGDKNTHQLMVNFYGEILKGNSYSRSIRNAKLNLIQKKETAFPKFWSGFVLIGK
jgi:CHAT domain-containing protein/Tfp pilus assembly protein PilF